jgi:dihydrodipicolinate synthase/N-acetylneuraminate lyase
VLVYAAVPTLFTADGDLDMPANRRLYQHAGSQLDGLFVAGTTG